MKATILGLGLILAALSVPCWAQDRTTYFLTGNQLYEFCQSNRGQAQAYIMGYNDGIALRDEVNQQGTFCPPVTAKSGQFVDLVCQALVSDPANRHWPAAFIAHGALVHAWPCPK